MKKVYNYADNGVYVGVDVAQESPMEPGVFLMPRNSTDVKPPKAKKGYFIVWDKESASWKQCAETQLPQSEGAPVLSTEAGERVWRDRELARADIELNKVEDGDGVGTPKEWREYRVALRAYPAQDNFGNSVKSRPTAPDAK